MKMESPAVLEQVSYRYPEATQDVVRDVSWNIAAESFTLVVGESGSGKSTLLRCLNGLVPHFTGGTFGGRVCIAGQDTRYHPPRSLSNHVGFVFQDPETQLLTQRVDDEIAFGLEQHGVQRPLMRKRVEEMLDLLGIAHLRERQPAHLSGGERQRVAIASALVLHPTILALDEPTSQLDPWAAEEVLSALARLNEDLGLTVVLVEHRLERTLFRADQVRWVHALPQADMTGTPAELARTLPSEAASPVTQLGAALGWSPLPLTIKSARPHARALGLSDEPPRQDVEAPGDRVLSLRDIRVQLDGRDVLTDISLDVHEGELVGLLGRNGSGKTTLLRTMLGVQSAQQGTVQRTQAGDSDAPIGYVPQQPGLLFYRDSLRDEIEQTLRRNERSTTASEYLEQFGLDDLIDRHPSDLSGGERQRAAIAVVMARNPRSLLLDEPTRGLDASGRRALIALLARLRGEGVAIVMATHDVELIAQTASRIVMLGEGEVIADGSPRETLSGSLAFTTQVNKLFGSSWLTVEEVLDAVGAPRSDTQ